MKPNRDEVWRHRASEDLFRVKRVGRKNVYLERLHTRIRLVLPIAIFTSAPPRFIRLTEKLK